MHPHNKERNSFIVRQNNNTNNNNNNKSDSTNTTQILPNMAWLNLDNKNNNRKFEMPLLGQHTSSILKELNYSQDEINKLVNEKVVSVPKLSKL
jgi:crotonobetainyl-CoA:carnitine CoA-transferase CaiB-like acyl-CoA transferase